MRYNIIPLVGEKLVYFHGQIGTPLFLAQAVPDL